MALSFLSIIFIAIIAYCSLTLKILIKKNKEQQLLYFSFQYFYELKLDE